MANLLNDISVILVKPKFPENIGMAARACANMGCPNLILINPACIHMKEMFKLATHQAQAILDNLCILPSLPVAACQFHRIFATTARLGGWRRSFLNPSQLGEQLASDDNNIKTGILFGPEDRGLNNDEIGYAQDLINIPTASGAASLNLAQSVLLILYAIRIQRNTSAGRANQDDACRIGYEQQLRLENNLKTVLLELDCLHGQNPEYFFRQWRHMLRRLKLKPHEYAAFMGLCRQIQGKINQTKNMDNDNH